MTEWGRWLRFCGVGLGGAIVQTVAVWTLTSWASVDYHAATLVGIATAVTHNFAWHWRWTWADRRRDGRIVQTFLTFATANGLIATLGNLAMMHALVGWLQVAIIPASIASIAVCHLASYGSARRVLGRRRAELGHARQTSLSRALRAPDVMRPVRFRAAERGRLSGGRSMMLGRVRRWRALPHDHDRRRS